MEDRKISGYRNDGYNQSEQREPSVKSSPPRSRTNSLQYGTDQQRGSQQAIQIQGDHQEPRAQTAGSSQSSNTLQHEFQHEFHGLDQQMGPHVAIPMQNLGDQQQQYVYVVPYEQQSVFRPTEQSIVRDTTTPMPKDQEDDGPVIQPPIGLTIFKRIMSALLIIFDICLNWMQVASWEGTVDIPVWVTFLGKVKESKGKSFVKVGCDDGSDTVAVAYIIFAVIGTVYALLRIADMIGETLLEYQKQYPSENKPPIRGFQILHGWIETAFAMACDDIPQMILLCALGVHCTLELTNMFKVYFWMIFKEIKNTFRVATCKHIYKPCCRSQKCCDDRKCCEYEWDLTCCCTILYFRPCAANKPCCETEKYTICPDLSCKREETCCGEYVKDPDWAGRLFEKEVEVYNLLFVAFIVLSILRYVGVI